MAQPGDVRGLCGQPVHQRAVAAGAGRARRGTGLVHRRGHPVAVVHGVVRQLCRGPGRRPRPGAGGLAARHEKNRGRQEASRTALRRPVDPGARRESAPWRCGARGSR